MPGSNRQLVQLERQPVVAASPPTATRPSTESLAALFAPVHQPHPRGLGALFLTDQHRGAIEALLLAIEQGQPVVALTGAAGIGKTTLLQGALGRLRDAGMRVLYHDAALRSGTLNDTLGGVGRSGRTVLAIDGAEALSPRVLQELMARATAPAASGVALHLVLAGRAELLEALRQGSAGGAAKRAPVLRTLAPFTPEEAARYVEHRVMKTGYPARQIITSWAVRAIAQGSGGVPAQADRLLDLAVEKATAEGEPWITARFAREACAAANPPARPAWARPAVRYAVAGLLLAGGLLLVLHPWAPDGAIHAAGGSGGVAASDESERLAEAAAVPRGVRIEAAAAPRGDRIEVAAARADEALPPAETVAAQSDPPPGVPGAVAVVAPSVRSGVVARDDQAAGSNPAGQAEAVRLPLAAGTGLSEAAVPATPHDVTPPRAAVVPREPVAPQMADGSPNDGKAASHAGGMATVTVSEHAPEAAQDAASGGRTMASAGVAAADATPAKNLLPKPEVVAASHPAPDKDPPASRGDVLASGVMPAVAVAAMPAANPVVLAGPGGAVGPKGAVGPEMAAPAALAVVAAVQPKDLVPPLVTAPAGAAPAADPLPGGASAASVVAAGTVAPGGASPSGAGAPSHDAPRDGDALWASLLSPNAVSGDMAAAGARASQPSQPPVVEAEAGSSVAHTADTPSLAAAAAAQPPAATPAPSAESRSVPGGGVVPPAMLPVEAAVVPQPPVAAPLAPVVVSVAPAMLPAPAVVVAQSPAPTSVPPAVASLAMASPPAASVVAQSPTPPAQAVSTAAPAPSVVPVVAPVAAPAPSAVPVVAPVAAPAPSAVPVVAPVAAPAPSAVPVVAPQPLAASSAPSVAMSVVGTTPPVPVAVSARAVTSAAPPPVVAPVAAAPPAGAATAPSEAPTTVAVASPVGMAAPAPHAATTAPPSAAAPAAAGAARDALPAAVIATLLRRGEAMRATGDISAARLLYERAAEAGSATAATEAGRLRDPAYLARLGAIGMAADPTAAATWYRRAIALGDTDAPALLQRLEEAAR